MVIAGCDLSDLWRCGQVWFDPPSCRTGRTSCSSGWWRSPSPRPGWIELCGQGTAPGGCSGSSGSSFRRPAAGSVSVVKVTWFFSISVYMWGRRLAALYLKEGNRLVEAGRHDDLSGGVELDGGESVLWWTSAVGRKTLLHLRQERRTELDHPDQQGAEEENLMTHLHNELRERITDPQDAAGQTVWGRHKVSRPPQEVVFLLFIIIIFIISCSDTDSRSGFWQKLK